MMIPRIYHQTILRRLIFIESYKSHNILAENSSYQLKSRMNNILPHLMPLLLTYFVSRAYFLLILITICLNTNLICKFNHLIHEIIKQNSILLFFLIVNSLLIHLILIDI